MPLESKIDGNILSLYSFDSHEMFTWSHLRNKQYMASYYNWRNVRKVTLPKNS